MSRREDNRPLATRALHIVAKVLIITALGMGLSSLLGDVGIPARALGVLGALAVGGTAVVVGECAAAAEKRRCEDERRAVEEEDRKVDEMVAEMAAPSLGLADYRALEQEARFSRFIEEQRLQRPSWKRGL
jgi:hypothetical protein